MKSKDKKELKTKTMQELKTMLSEKKRELFNHRLDKVQFKLKNTRILFSTRKEIAQILTVIKEQEVSHEKSA